MYYKNFDNFFSGDGDERKRPVIIHRAILGSVERMMAILTESYGGKWPFWLSPRQAIVVPVSPKYDEYANKVSMRSLSLRMIFIFLCYSYKGFISFLLEYLIDPLNTAPKCFKFLASVIASMKKDWCNKG